MWELYGVDEDEDEDWGGRLRARRATSMRLAMRPTKSAGANTTTSQSLSPKRLEWHRRTL